MFKYILAASLLILAACDTPPGALSQSEIEDVLVGKTIRYAPGEGEYFGPNGILNWQLNGKTGITLYYLDGSKVCFHGPTVPRDEGWCEHIALASDPNFVRFLREDDSSFAAEILGEGNLLSRL